MEREKNAGARIDVMTPQITNASELYAASFSVFSAAVAVPRACETVPIVKPRAIGCVILSIE